MKFLVIFVSLFFIFSSTVKLFGIPPGMAEFQFESFFKKFGYSRRFMRWVGLGELSGAIMAWFWGSHWIGAVGAGLLVFITASAASHHIRFKQPRLGAPAYLMLIASAILFLSSF
jgi:hypothetical protein